MTNHTKTASKPFVEKYKRLLELVSPNDTLGILIKADPDGIASAMALKRLFWRKANKVLIYRLNTIKRADNLAFVKLLKIDIKHIRRMKRKDITKWAIVDSQPSHDEEFMNYTYDIIIDHHPPDPHSIGQLVDVHEDYGANSSIMTEYLRAAKIKPSPKLATALFYGIKTDTQNFIRSSTSHDINAFRYLYQYANINIIKKIESSELTKHTLGNLRHAIDRQIQLKNVSYVHMGDIDNPDTLVIIADFFMKLAEATWSVVSGVFNDKLIIIFRKAGFRGNAGKAAQKLFGSLGGSAGGHKEAARAEIAIEDMMKAMNGETDFALFVENKLKELK